MKNPDSIIYERYTSTSVRPEQIQIKQFLELSSEKFIRSYSPFLPKSKDAFILDIGCGFGKNIYALISNNYTNVKGIDTSIEQVEFANRELKLGKFIIHGDAIEFLKQDIGYYDCILLIDVLEHLELTDALKLGELMFARLREGGSLIVQLPNGLAPLSPFLWGDLTHKRAFTRDSILQYFRIIGSFDCSVFELPPNGIGMKEAIRRFFWWSIFRPIIRICMKFIHGGTFGDIYTANIGAVAVKLPTTK
jgi:2-polyprenyl-3-methyl-5-hydroxy-6-metoxy-1,4-benzoquinol methylase